MLATRLVLGAAAASAIVLTGCAPTGDVAIEVGGTSFSTTDVDLLTKFQCSIASDENVGAPPISRATARSFMATVLVSTVLDKKIGADSGVTLGPAEAAATMTSLDPYIEKVTRGEDRERLRKIVEDSVIGQLAVSSVVQTALGEALSQLPQEQAAAAVAEGTQRLRIEAAQDLDIEIDPAFGLSENGLETGKSDASLSRALSDFARAGASDSAEKAWLDDLPASQRCS